jgi:hypothetical protein
MRRAGEENRTRVRNVGRNEGPGESRGAEGRTMSPITTGSRARILIKIESLSSRLGAIERQMTAADPNSRPILEVGRSAIQQELMNLSRQLR